MNMTRKGWRQVDVPTGWVKIIVALHEALEQNYQLQNQLEKQIVNHQEQEKLNAELHFKLLEEKAHCK